MFIEPSAAIETAVALYDNRKALARATAQLKRIVTHGKTQLVVFGSGGVGKSTLGALLTGKYQPPLGHVDYKESIRLERYALEGNLFCDVLVPPGQERWRGTAWPELYRELAKGRVMGIINVVSWGHHSFERLQGYRDTPLYKPPMTKEDYLSAYLENRREIEHKISADFLLRLQDAPNKLWMITLVTKQDLWWKHRQDVRNHYSEGAYHTSIEQVLHHRGINNFTHEYLSASLVMSNLITGTGEILVPTTEGYDQNIQIANLRHSVETVRKLVEG